jgi:hypothetical protein
LITEQELSIIRPYTLNKRQVAFQNNTTCEKARIRLSLSEISQVNAYRKQNGLSEIKVSDRLLKDPEFMAAAAKAERRHNVVESLKAQGISSRSADAKKMLG